MVVHSLKMSKKILLNQIYVKSISRNVRIQLLDLLDDFDIDRRFLDRLVNIFEDECFKQSKLIDKLREDFEFERYEDDDDDYCEYLKPQLRRLEEKVKKQQEEIEQLVSKNNGLVEQILECEKELEKEKCKNPYYVELKQREEDIKEAKQNHTIVVNQTIRDYQNKIKELEEQHRNQITTIQNEHEEQIKVVRRAW